MKKILSLYYRAKLWYWWTYIMRKDEFNEGPISIYYKYNSKYNREEQQSILIFRRNIAHDLDAGKEIKDIPYNIIKKAKI